MNEDTRLLHDGEEKWRTGGGPVNPPVVRASLFAFDTYADFREAMAAANERPLYSRNFNPTVAALEEKIAMLEQTERAIAFSSGMGAITAVLLAFLKAGDHLLIVDCVYGPTRTFAETILTGLGVAVEFFPPEETLDGARRLAGRLRDNTRLVYLESPGSLSFAVQDLAAAADLCRARGIATAADNSWASPLYQKPHAFGIDVVVHTGSKYIAGHSDLVFGVAACDRRHFDIIKPVAVLLGAVPSADDAYLALRGLRTLPLRMQQHFAGGLAVAHWLEKRPEVVEVLHPGLETFPDHELAHRQMSGCGGLFGFRLQPAPAAAHHAFVDALRLFTLGVSWGGFESLLLPLDFIEAERPDLRARLGVGDHQFRIFVGLESPADLTADLEQGLAEWTVWRERG